MIIIVLMGAFVGLLMGITGAGGGILSVPLLVFTLQLPIAQAGPIALSAITVSAGLGALIGLRTKILRYKAAILMAVCGVIVAPVGLWLAQRIPNAPLLLGFSTILIYVSIRMYLQARNVLTGGISENRKPPPCLLNPVHGKLIWTVPCARSLMLAGAVAGLFSGLLGVGGGFVIVPALKKYTDLPMKAIVATSLGVLAMVSGGGAVMSLASGVLNTEIAIPFALGSLLGLIIGKMVEKKLSGPHVQQLFAVFTCLVALSMIYKAT